MEREHVQVPALHSPTTNSLSHSLWSKIPGDTILLKYHVCGAAEAAEWCDPTSKVPGSLIAY